MKLSHRPLRVVPGFLTALLATLVVACSSGKPEATVETLEFAAAKGDVETVIRQVSLAGFKDSDLLQAKGKLQMMTGEMQKQATSRGGLKSVETVESKVSADGKTATVRVMLKFGNGQLEKPEEFKLIQEGGRWKVKLFS